jgi:LAO/AO transport system kinase
MPSDEKKLLIDLAEGVLTGSVKALGRLITLIEYNLPGSTDALKKLYPHSNNAYVIGITGAPGTGKSTLVDKLSLNISKRGYDVGIIAIDPSSPFSGGALLGDRFRMVNSALDKNIYTRSMGTRGSMGGLSQATSGAIIALDAFGKDIILVETCGTGQAEVDVISATDTTVVVCVPGLGDEIQAMKAGVMEIGDIFAANKADLNNVEKLISEVELMLHVGMGFDDRQWKPSVVKTIALQEEGIDQLVDKIFEHRDYLVESKELERKKKERIRREVFEIVKNEMIQRIESLEADNQNVSEGFIEQVLRRKMDPYTAAEDLLKYLNEALDRSTETSIH